MSLTVAIPTWKNPYQLRDTLLSLVRNTDFAGRILVVNNGPVNQPSYEWIQGQIPYEVDWIDAEKNLGWAGGINRALAETKTDLFCMLNDDVLFPPCSTDWWGKLLGWFDHAMTGGVGPTSNYVSGAQSAFQHLGHPVLRVAFLIGFCAVYRTEHLKEMGGLDELLPGGDDIDLSIRYRKRGLYLIADRRCYLHHHGAQTGRRVHEGYWDSSLHQAETYNALIRKHGLREWYEYTSTPPDSTPSLWVADGTVEITRQAMTSCQDSLEGLFAKARTEPSDINQHLDILYRLASGCRSVVETGTADGTSTAALLAAQPETLDCFDIERKPEVDTLERLAGATKFTFHQQSVLEADGNFPEADMWFVDDLHTYDHVKEELRLHAGKIRRVIAFHDVAIFRDRGELEGTRGIWPAIAEYLREHPEWRLTYSTEKNNGLAVITRVS